MARLRFPGRPGCRFDRNLSKQTGDGLNLSLSAELKLISTINDGLQRFHDVFGDDELEDNEGFSGSDVTDCDKQLNRLRGKLSKKVGEVQLATMGHIGSPSVSVLADGTNLDDVTQAALMASVGLQQVHSASTNAVGVERKSMAKGIRSAKIKSRLKNNRTDLQLIGIKKPNAKAKKQGLSIHADCLNNALPTANITSGEGLSMENVESDELLQAKQEILAQAQDVAEKKHKAVTSAKQHFVKRIAFHLPVRSAHSSRHVKPNKRFLDDSFSYGDLDVNKHFNRDGYEQSLNLSGTDSFHSNTQISAANMDKSKMQRRSNNASTGHPDLPSSLAEAKAPLLNQPLIVEGKRERKVSVKLLSKLANDADTSISGIAKETINEADEELKSPGAILRQPTLRLDEAVMNRSKAALIRNLKRQMQRHRRKAGTNLEDRTAVERKEVVHPSFGLKPTAKFGESEAKFSSVPGLAMETSAVSQQPACQVSQQASKILGDGQLEPPSWSSLAVYDSRKQCCVVCHVVLESMSFSPAHPLWRHWCCRNCTKAYEKECIVLAKAGTGFDVTCSIEGHEGSDDPKILLSCETCHYNKCRKYFVAPESLPQVKKLLEKPKAKEVTSDSTPESVQSQVPLAYENSGKKSSASRCRKTSLEKPIDSAVSKSFEISNVGIVKASQEATQDATSVATQGVNSTKTKGSGTARAKKVLGKQKRASKKDIGLYSLVGGHDVQGLDYGGPFLGMSGDLEHENSMVDDMHADDENEGEEEVSSKDQRQKQSDNSNTDSANKADTREFIDITLTPVKQNKYGRARKSPARSKDYVSLSKRGSSSAHKQQVSDSKELVAAKSNTNVTPKKGTPSKAHRGNDDGENKKTPRRRRSSTQCDESENKMSSRKGNKDGGEFENIDEGLLGDDSLDEMDIDDAEPCESVDASQDGGDDNESSTQLSVGGRSGPRIKNVCRRASIALGARAVFPPTDVLMSPPKLAQELTLSALSEAEKGRVVMERKTTAERRKADDMDIQDIIKHAREHKQSDLVTIIRSPAKAAEKARVFRPKLIECKRKVRCKTCAACLLDNCGLCENCNDTKQLGENAAREKSCIQRKCLNPSFKRLVQGKKTVKQTTAPSSEEPGTEENAEKATTNDEAVLENGRNNSSSNEVGYVIETCSETDGLETESDVSSSPERWRTHDQQNSEDDDDDDDETDRRVSRGGRGRGRGGRGRGGRGRRFDGHLPLPVALSPGKRGRRIGDTRMPIVSVTDINDQSFEEVEELPDVGTAETTERADDHVINADFDENLDIDCCWQEGLAILTSATRVAGVICFLCGSGGKDNMVYCNVCCEPFHHYCLDEHEQPQPNNKDNWCCRRCQYCKVCGGRESGLLRCDKCQEAFHSDCLGPNHPTKRSKAANAWLCTKCVKCKSCGATTPGKSKDATWTYDFSLCYSCGQLMSKGNFCPVCHKCYSNDDWTTKMIQCSTCDSWVHAKCEGLTDDLYELLSCMPEETPYHCKVCQPTGRPAWCNLLQQEMVLGFNSVLKALDDSNVFNSSNIGPNENKRTPATSAEEILQYDADDSNVPVTVAEHRQNAEELLELSRQEVHSDDLGETVAVIQMDASGCAFLLPETTPDEVNKAVEEMDMDIAMQLAPSGTDDSDREQHKCPDVAPTASSSLTAESFLSPLSVGLDASSKEEGKEKDKVAAATEVPVGPVLSSLVVASNLNWPRNVDDIRDKVKRGEYAQVEDFSTDIIRIIQYNINALGKDEQEQAKTGKKDAIGHIRSTFIKQMEQEFPWFKVRKARMWTANHNLPEGMLADAVLPPSEDHMYAQWREKPEPAEGSLDLSGADEEGLIPATSSSAVVAPSPRKKEVDQRACVLCGVKSDDHQEDAGRLVYAGQDEWVHINCALWSAEVYEEVDGTLQNVAGAISRGRHLPCTLCEERGATVGCCEKGCSANYHLHCAIRDYCIFQEDKRVYCKHHWASVNEEIVTPEKFAVQRRACVELGNNKQCKRYWQKGFQPQDLHVYIGSMRVECFGRISPLSDMRAALCPVGFSVSRTYWSTVDARRRVTYTCSVVEHCPSDIVSECRQKMADIRIVHDPDHPDYDPVKLAEFEALEALERLKRNTGLTLPLPARMSATVNRERVTSSEERMTRSKAARLTKPEPFDNDAKSSSGGGSIDVAMPRLENTEQDGSTEAKLTTDNLKKLSQSTLRQLGLQEELRALPQPSSVESDQFTLLNGDVPPSSVDQSLSGLSKSAADAEVDRALQAMIERLNKAAAVNREKAQIERRKSKSRENSQEPVENMKGKQLAPVQQIVHIVGRGSEDLIAQTSPSHVLAAGSIEQSHHVLMTNNQKKPGFTRQCRSQSAESSAVVHVESRPRSASPSQIFSDGSLAQLYADDSIEDPAVGKSDFLKSFLQFAKTRLLDKNNSQERAHNGYLVNTSKRVVTASQVAEEVGSRSLLRDNFTRRTFAEQHSSNEQHNSDLPACLQLDGTNDDSESEASCVLTQCARCKDFVQQIDKHTCMAGVSKFADGGTNSVADCNGSEKGKSVEASRVILIRQKSKSPPEALHKRGPQVEVTNGIHEQQGMMDLLSGAGRMDDGPLLSPAKAAPASQNLKRMLTAAQTSNDSRTHATANHNGHATSVEQASCGTQKLVSPPQSASKLPQTIKSRPLTAQSPQSHQILSSPQSHQTLLLSPVRVEQQPAPVLQPILVASSPLLSAALSSQLQQPAVLLGSSATVQDPKLQYVGTFMLPTAALNPVSQVTFLPGPTMLAPSMPVMSPNVMISPPAVKQVMLTNGISLGGVFNLQQSPVSNVISIQQQQPSSANELQQGGQRVMVVNSSQNQSYNYNLLPKPAALSSLGRSPVKRSLLSTNLVHQTQSVKDSVVEVLKLSQSVPTSNMLKNREVVARPYAFHSEGLRVIEERGYASSSGASNQYGSSNNSAGLQRSHVDILRSTSGAGYATALDEFVQFALGQPVEDDFGDESPIPTTLDQLSSILLQDDRGDSNQPVQQSRHGQAVTRKRPISSNDMGYSAPPSKAARSTDENSPEILYGLPRTSSADYSKAGLDAESTSRAAAAGRRLGHLRPAPTKQHHPDFVLLDEIRDTVNSRGLCPQRSKLNHGSEYSSKPDRHLTSFNRVPKVDRRPMDKKNNSSISKHQRITAGSIDILKEWLFMHQDCPYPRDDEKLMLAAETGMALNQVNNWFINARRRLLDIDDGAYNHQRDHHKSQRYVGSYERRRVTDKYGVPMAQSRMSGVHSAPLGRSHVMPRKPLVNPKVSPHKNTNPKSVYHSGPQVRAHPIIHSQHQQLPTAEQEEEVMESVSAAISNQTDAFKLRPPPSKDGPHLLFEITSSEGFHVQASTPEEAVRTLTDKVNDARTNAKMMPLSYTGLNSLHMFGLAQYAITYLTEQLFGAENCRNYRFKYHHLNRQQQNELVENPNGTARAESYDGRKPHDTFSFLLSRYRRKPLLSSKKSKDHEMSLKSQRRPTAMDLPMAMRFRHLKIYARQAVGVYRSPIHGRGLYCKRDLEAGEMVIEYAGEIIRNIICDRREQYYESKGIGCYMFRIDDNEVVDATMKGNAARFINHCCEPNCFSKIISVEGTKHIVIFALRTIRRGEELTYDYKFPLEDVKIACSCSAQKCRGYLN